MALMYVCTHIHIYIHYNIPKYVLTIFIFVEQLSFKGMEDEGVDMDMDGRQCSQVSLFK